MSALTVDNDLIHYEVLGRGRPVILLHGWIGSWRYWVPTLQKLQANYRVYALDLYGFGDSAKDPARYSLDQQAAMLGEFMREMGLPKAALIGHGLGALVAAEFARRNPDKVARLMLVSAPLFDPGDLESRAAARKPVVSAPAVPLPPVVRLNALSAPPSLTSGAAMRAALLEATRPRLADSPVTTPAATPTPPKPDPVTTSEAPAATTPAKPAPVSNPLTGILTDGETLLGKAFKRSEPEYDKLQVDLAKTDANALRQSIATFDAGRLLDTLRQFTMPVAAIHGADDPILPPPPDAVWHYVTGDKENFVPVPLPNVRHFPMLEHDQFARLVTDFLDAPDVTKLEIKERWRRRTR
jgi:pimeloyl-ACP methyl ester carboxylesterase